MSSLSTLAATVTSTGITAPDYPTILATLQSAVQAIYGSDIDLDPDSQDGQFIAIFAQAINQSNQVAIATYNQFSPTTAQGVGLSSVVKINGLKRIAPTNSTAPVQITGQVGTVITNGAISDATGQNRWTLPVSVVIPIAGTITVTATCQTQGAIAALAGTLTAILTPTRGWQSVTNNTDATPGGAAEPDPTLRQRQSVSTALPAETPMDAIVAAVANVPGVERFAGYENNTGTTDANGIPGHYFSIVVAGGDVTAIANAIASKKGPGPGTYGTTSIIVVDPIGIPNTINFFELETIEIWVSVSGTALNNYTSAAQQAGIAAIINLITTLAIGGDVYVSWVEAAAQLLGTALGQTFKLNSVEIGFSSGSLGTSDLPIDFNKAATTDASKITWNVS